MADSIQSDEALLSGVVEAVRAAGREVKRRFSPGARPADAEAVWRALRANDEASVGVLREGLARVRPGAGWVEDELETGALPAGEWWVVDPVEGNINHVHGLADWCVSATLVRDNVAVLTVVDLPMTGQLFRAVRGGGAHEGTERLRTSAKTALEMALVGTGQANPGESPDVYRRIGASVTAMLERAVVLRVSVPATLQLVQVAAGRMDAFWQHSEVLSGLLAGALLVEEAGGRISDTRGAPWGPTSRDFLATAPGLHGAAVSALGPVA